MSRTGQPGSAASDAGTGDPGPATYEAVSGVR